MKVVVVPPKAVRRRVNFSKVRAEVAGRQYTFSLTKERLVVRLFHSPKPTTLTFEELINATATQRLLL